MKKYLTKLKRKDTWVRIYTKNGKVHTGQITSIRAEFFFLSYRVGKNDLIAAIKFSQVTTVECLTCENSDVWTTGV